MSTVSNNSTVNNVLAGLGRSESVAKKEEDMQSRFLTLLTTQLKNQDPMNPMENAELTSQLAQMSTVDGIERLNKMFQSFIDSQGTSESMAAAALIGRGVLVEGRRLGLTDAGAVGGFEIDNGADRVTLSIKDASGLEVQKIELSDVAAGSHNFMWDGTAMDGTRAANGSYTLELLATAGDDKLTGRTLEFGAVTSIIRGARGSDFQVGDLGVFKFDDIKQIL